MNTVLLKILRCPVCRNEFRHYNDLLICKKNHKFPLIEGVPQLVVELKDYKKTEKSFSVEWGILKKDKTPNLNKVRTNFLKDLNIEKDDAKNKFILEAGCGRGYVGIALSELVGKNGMFVGLDMSESIFRANQRKYQLTKNTESIQFIRGNIDKPPFKERTFDIIYSFGVLHHTPDTYNSFKSLVPLLKKNGKFYLGVYRKDRRDDTRIVSFIYGSREFVNKLPLPAIYAICFILAPFAKVYAYFNTITGRRPAFNKTLKEFMWSLFDHFSPQYVHRHTIEEVEKWFKEQGFNKTEVKMDDRIGFAILGTKN